MRLFDDLTQRKLSELVGDTSFSAVLHGKIAQIMKHLTALRERIENTSSKVLVTGDLNAGKSTFCNALLRKKVLPEDQQPCTSIFCEVLDARENSNIEEVHAISADTEYNPHDESTYEVFPLDKLEELVVENEEYAQVKVYVEDARMSTHSLLHNGVVDIAIIDAPGLNTDSFKTTQVFARQEEIDVVVFVVNAENHFTESAKNFIANAASEKAYIFIVVNRFDNIRDKARCKRLIMDQVATLTPQTHLDATELVHFVSSNAVINNEEPDKLAEFEALEQSLRSFVLDKRARSKLAPAKTYLLNLLGDLEMLADYNKETLAQKIGKIAEELDELTPAFNEATKARVELSDTADKTIEDIVNDVYKHSRRTISKTISHVDDAPSVPYDSVFGAFSYAEATKQAMLSTIQGAVHTSEDYARTMTSQGISSISALGLLHLKDEFVEKTFRPEFMFSRKRHQMAKDVKIDIDVFDFFDFDRQEKFAGGGMALTVASLAGTQLLGISSWVDGLWKATSFLGVKNTKKLIGPIILAGAAIGAYVALSDIPNAVPRKLAKKIRQQLQDMDYIHANSDRIAKESRKVLHYPAQDLKVGFQRSIDKQHKSVEDRKQMKKDSETAAKYFGNLLREVKQEKTAISTLDLEPAQQQPQNQNAFAGPSGSQIETQNGPDPLQPAFTMHT